MEIREARTEDEAGLVALIAYFRVALAAVRGKERPVDLEAAREELVDYLVKGYPIFVAVTEQDELVGYLVCRVDGAVVWAESLYVQPEFRRRGVGSALYARAEELALELGGDPPYNWVDPDNDGIIRFLQKRGYNVLNLVELRCSRDEEKDLRGINVGKYSFNR